MDLFASPIETSTFARDRFRVMCWNIANPSVERAAQQAAWLISQQVQFMVLTESKDSKGCAYLSRYFNANGFYVLSPSYGKGEYGVMIVSSLPMRSCELMNNLEFLPSRMISVTVTLDGSDLEIIGTYIPSRDVSIEKIERKRNYLTQVQQALESWVPIAPRIFCGDFNVLEPQHIPHYPIFKNWEYDFYSSLETFKLVDAYRALHPDTVEHSWVGRFGDGYRYDHCFISSDLLPRLKLCTYDHQPRLARLSDHSSLILDLSMA
ncbi:MAG: endonuclease/exonuclease/phosphatase family protein [Chthonomonadales bacterium]